jgi:hypothetical protein
MALTQEKFEEICIQLESSPKGIWKILTERGIACELFYKCVNSSEQNNLRYARAKERQCDNIADYLTDISDNADDSNKARVQIDARKFYLSKIKPKKYGDHQVIEIQSAVGDLARIAATVIAQYVPEDKRSEALGKLQSAIDFGG